MGRCWFGGGGAFLLLLLLPEMGNKAVWRMHRNPAVLTCLTSSPQHTCPLFKPVHQQSPKVFVRPPPSLKGSGEPLHSFGLKRGRPLVRGFVVFFIVTESQRCWYCRFAIPSRGCAYPRGCFCSHRGCARKDCGVAQLIWEKLIWLKEIYPHFCVLEENKHASRITNWCNAEL